MVEKKQLSGIPNCVSVLVWAPWKQTPRQEFGCVALFGRRSQEAWWGSGEVRQGRKRSPQNGCVDEQSQLEQVEPNSAGMPQKECAENPSGCPPGARKRRYLSTSSPLSLFESCSGDGSSLAGLACSPSQRMALCRETQDPKFCVGPVSRWPQGWTNGIHWSTYNIHNNSFQPHGPQSSVELLLFQLQFQQALWGTLI